MRQVWMGLTFSNLQLSLPRYDMPIRTQGDLDVTKYELLKFGDQLLASFGTNKGKSDW